MRHSTCVCGKRSFFSERDAERALGRTQHKRRTKHDKRGTRRGMDVEHRLYTCDQNEDVYHLTGVSRSTYERGKVHG